MYHRQTSNHIKSNQIYFSVAGNNKHNIKVKS